MQNEMDLSCPEQINSNVVNYAEKDPTIFSDPRVVANLLENEENYVPNENYFLTVQSDIQPFMRKVVTTWMLEVCEEQMCEEQVLPLAVSYMDRFLSVCDIKRQQLQLLGATCLLIASKIRTTNILPIDLLCAYTDYSVSYEHIVSWEMLVLSKLEWNIASITGYDYIDQVIERCAWGSDSHLLRRHSHTLVSICYTDPTFIQTRPSLIAAACICSAVRGLKLSSADIATNDISNMLKVNPITLELLVNLIDRTVEKVNPQTPEKQSQKTQGYESPQYPQPETPTEVENVYF